MSLNIWHLRIQESLEILLRVKIFHFHEVDLHAGDQIPELKDYDGLWVMGGSMNVWEEDKYPWLIDEKIAISQAVKDS